MSGTQLQKTAPVPPVWALTFKSSAQGELNILACGKDRAGRVDLDSGLKALGSRGIGRLLVEGGAALARTLLDLDFVDEIHLFRAPYELGGKGVQAPLELITEDKFRLRETVLLGEDILTVYDRAN